MGLQTQSPGEAPICEIEYGQEKIQPIAKERRTEQIEKSILVRVTIQIVALAFELEQSDLLNVRRGTTKIARARQIAAYLLNTTLSFPLVEIGRLFQKDRTTIGYACRLIEDLRDDPTFDDRICELEDTIRLVMDLANKKL